MYHLCTREKNKSFHALILSVLPTKPVRSKLLLCHAKGEGDKDRERQEAPPQKHSLLQEEACGSGNRYCKINIFDPSLQA